MTEEQYSEFVALRDEFREKVHYYTLEYPEFSEEILKQYDNSDKIMRAFVYNEKLDYLEKNDSIKYIWVTDNPGFNESLQNKYAVGISGKAGKNFMEENGFVKDYDREVIVLNKSFVHTKVTADLKKLKEYEKLSDDIQIFMSDLACKLQKIFKCELWILGLSNLKKLFKTFEGYLEKYGDMEQTYFYYHFSQGQFKKAYNRKKNEVIFSDSKEICEIIGIENRKKILKG
jgi:hypothetical protein